MEQQNCDERSEERGHHRDEHFDHHIAQIELALDAQLWGTSPVVDAVKRLGRRLKSRRLERAANDQPQTRVA